MKIENKLITKNKTQLSDAIYMKSIRGKKKILEKKINKWEKETERRMEMMMMMKWMGKEKSEWVLLGEVEYKNNYSKHCI